MIIHRLVDHNVGYMYTWWAYWVGLKGAQVQQSFQYFGYYQKLNVGHQGIHFGWGYHTFPVQFQKFITKATMKVALKRTGIKFHEEDN